MFSDWQQTSAGAPRTHSVSACADYQHLPASVRAHDRYADDTLGDDR